MAQTPRRDHAVAYTQPRAPLEARGACPPPLSFSRAPDNRFRRFTALRGYQATQEDVGDRPSRVGQEEKEMITCVLRFLSRLFYSRIILRNPTTSQRFRTVLRPVASRAQARSSTVGLSFDTPNRQKILNGVIVCFLRVPTPRRYPRISSGSGVSSNNRAERSDKIPHMRSLRRDVGGGPETGWERGLESQLPEGALLDDRLLHYRVPPWCKCMMLGMVVERCMCARSSAGLHRYGRNCNNA